MEVSHEMLVLMLACVWCCVSGCALDAQSQWGKLQCLTFETVSKWHTLWKSWKSRTTCLFGCLQVCGVDCVAGAVLQTCRVELVEVSHEMLVLMLACVWCCVSGCALDAEIGHKRSMACKS